MPRSARQQREPPPTSPGLDDFSVEIRHAGDRRLLSRRVETIKEKLTKTLSEEDWEIVEVSGRGAKKNLAQRLSASIAQKIADALRPTFDGILPDELGGGHESFSKGAQGLKKLDVNYSTKRSGLELAVSVKTINFADDATSRYTKNIKRVDGELRAEAQDCHRRQPFAVICAYLFMPQEASQDGKNGKSSAKHAAEVLAARSGRQKQDDPHEKVELSFLGLYGDDGVVHFCRPHDLPDNGGVKRPLKFSQTLEELKRTYSARNK